MGEFENRFGGIGRLYGQSALAKLASSRMIIVGLGGVGTWVAEALARSGVSHLRLIDLDEICISNVNRQLPAMDGTIGRAKVDVMAERLRQINPAGHFEAVSEYFTQASADRLLCFSGLSGDRENGPTAIHPDCVIDAIDAVTNKCHLIAHCRARGIPCVSCGGAGGRRDPTQVRIADLHKVTHDRLLSEVRKRLRQQHGFPRDSSPMEVPAVYSLETPLYPHPDGTVGDRPMSPSEGVGGPRLNCNWGYGSATHVTGTFGFVAAARAIETVLGLVPASSQLPPIE